MAQIYTANEIMPTEAEIQKILEAKLSYEKAQQTKSAADFKAWTSSHFNIMPWGISYLVSIGNRKLKGKTPPTDKVLRYFIIAVAIGWQDLIDQLKRTLKGWGYTTEDLRQMVTNVWQDPANTDKIAATIEKIQLSNKLTLTEAVEKHDTLNTKLFTKEDILKDRVHDKLLEVVDEFLADLKEQDIKLKVDDILLIGSNASYNYTKNSDIDLHIVANAKAVNYSSEICNALYGAYRTLFNKQLDIQFFDIPVEIFVEIEDSPRVSNGVYSVKKNKWIKKPVHEDIPEYDKEALDDLVSKWEEKCKTLIDDIKADRLDDEKKVLKMLEDIYDKLRKKGVAKGEYSIENLAFKELRNKGYLDTLKDSRNDLVSKRLSLEETLSRKDKADIYNKITQIAGSAPIIQDNGMFFIYNLKEANLSSIVAALRKLPYVINASAYDSGKYDFSNVLHIATNKIPAKYYNIHGQIDEELI